MSDIVEKTLASLPGLITGGLVGSPQSTDAQSGQSRSFVSFVKSLRDCTTKYEEEQVLNKEVKLLRQKLSLPDTTQAQIKEYVLQLMFCDMLGCDVSFGYINAIKLAQQGSLAERRVGYLAACMFLHEDHELCVLLVNSLQKDMRSSNILEVCCALTVICQLANVEVIPMILPLVEEKLNHPKELVRKKAVMCLHRFHSKAPNLVQHIHHRFRKALCDKDPAVMATALHIYTQLITADPSKYKDIVPSLINVLRQVIERKLPKSFEYHHVPAPWIQITVMKMLALLGKEDQKTSQLIYPVLTEVLQRSEINQNITYGVVHECILTGATIYPHRSLLEDLAKCVGKFLRAKSNNLRYLGLKSLAAIVQVDPVYAVSHQLTVIDCLEDKDVAIRRKTLDLLCEMTNQFNVAVICAKLMDHFKRDTDHYLRTDVVNKILLLSEKFCTSLEWYIEMVNSVILSAAGFMSEDVCHTVINIISGGIECVITNDDGHRFAVECYMKLLQDKGLNTPPLLVQISAWVIGSYWNLLIGSAQETAPSLITLLVPFTLSDNIKSSTKHWVLNALSKLVVSCPGVECLDEEFIEMGQGNRDPELCQHVTEVIQLSKASQECKGLMTGDYSSINQFDFTLSFLDDFVYNALENGASPYRTISLRMQETDQDTEAVTSLFASLKHTAYEAPPTVPSQYSKSSLSGYSGSSGNKDQKELTLNLKDVKRVWGPEGARNRERHNTILDHQEKDNIQASTEPPGTEKQQLSSVTQTVQKTGSPINLKPEISEEDRRKQDLAKSLFSGIS